MISISDYIFPTGLELLRNWQNRDIDAKKKDEVNYG